MSIHEYAGIMLLPTAVCSPVDETLSGVSIAGGGSHDGWSSAASSGYSTCLSFAL